MRLLSVVPSHISLPQESAWPAHTCANQQAGRQADVVSGKPDESLLIVSWKVTVPGVIRVGGFPQVSFSGNCCWSFLRSSVGLISEG